MKSKCASEWNGLAIVKNQRKIINFGYFSFTLLFFLPFSPELPMPAPTLTSSLPPSANQGRKNTSKKKKKKRQKSKLVFPLIDWSNHDKRGLGVGGRAGHLRFVMIWMDNSGCVNETCSCTHPFLLFPSRKRKHLTPT